MKKNDGKTIALENKITGEKRTFHGVKYNYNALQNNGWYVFTKTKEKNERLPIYYLYNIKTNKFINIAFNSITAVVDANEYPIENTYLLSNENKVVLVNVENLNHSPVFAMINSNTIGPWLRVKKERNLYSPYFFYNMQTDQLVPSVVDNEYLAKFKNTYDGYYDSHFERNFDELLKSISIFTEQKLNKALSKKTKKHNEHDLVNTTINYVDTINEIKQNLLSYGNSVREF